MKQKLSLKQLELYEFIDKLLYDQRNPIGIDDLPEDEYSSYTPGIFSMVIHDYDTEQIADKLLSIKQKMISLKCNKQNCLNIAGQIISKRKDIGL
jgi:hypothetical protein